MFLREVVFTRLDVRYRYCLDLWLFLLFLNRRLGSEQKLPQSFSVIYSGRFKFRGVFYVESAPAYSTAS